MDNSPEYTSSRFESVHEAALVDYKKIVEENEEQRKLLENKLRELNKSNKELEEFAYVASHDLQEPLRKITSFSERLKQKLTNNPDADIQLYLNRMLVATGNMRTLIDNLLEFSRSSRNEEPFVKTDLNAIIPEVMVELELKIDETTTTIESKHLPVIEAIPSQMKQLFTNLCANAIKFKKSDSLPRVVITSSPLTIQQKEKYHLSSDEQYHLISVADNGIGFEQEYSQKIFQIFQRLHGKADIRVRESD